jgi:hypothetical protein
MVEARNYEVRLLLYTMIVIIWVEILWKSRLNIDRWSTSLHCIPLFVHAVTIIDWNLIRRCFAVRNTHGLPTGCGYVRMRKKKPSWASAYKFNLWCSNNCSNIYGGHITLWSVERGKELSHVEWSACLRLTKLTLRRSKFDRLPTVSTRER